MDVPDGSVGRRRSLQTNEPFIVAPCCRLTELKAAEARPITSFMRRETAQVMLGSLEKQENWDAGQATAAQRVRQNLLAFQTPEHRPDGPRPFHVPFASFVLKRPVPLASRGPATAFIRTCPFRETVPAIWIG